jgi:hypothetical protein
MYDVSVSGFLPPLPSYELEPSTSQREEAGEFRNYRTRMRASKIFFRDVTGTTRATDVDGFTMAADVGIWEANIKENPHARAAIWRRRPKQAPRPGVLRFPYIVRRILRGTVPTTIIRSKRAANPPTSATIYRPGLTLEQLRTPPSGTANLHLTVPCRIRFTRILFLHPHFIRDTFTKLLLWGWNGSWI